MEFPDTNITQSWQRETTTEERKKMVGLLLQVMMALRGKYPQERLVYLAQQYERVNFNRSMTKSQYVENIKHKMDDLRLLIQKQLGGNDANSSMNMMAMNGASQSQGGPQRNGQMMGSQAGGMNQGSNPGSQRNAQANVNMWNAMAAPQNMNVPLPSNLTSQLMGGGAQMSMNQMGGMNSSQLDNQMGGQMGNQMGNQPDMGQMRKQIRTSMGNGGQIRNANQMNAMGNSQMNNQMMNSMGNSSMNNNSMNNNSMNNNQMNNNSMNNQMSNQMNNHLMGNPLGNQMGNQMANTQLATNPMSSPLNRTIVPNATNALNSSTGIGNGSNGGNQLNSAMLNNSNKPSMGTQMNAQMSMQGNRVMPNQPGQIGGRMMGNQGQAGPVRVPPADRDRIVREIVPLGTLTPLPKHLLLQFPSLPAGTSTWDDVLKLARASMVSQAVQAELKEKYQRYISEAVIQKYTSEISMNRAQNPQQQHQQQQINNRQQAQNRTQAQQVQAQQAQQAQAQQAQVQKAQVNQQQLKAQAERRHAEANYRQQMLLQQQQQQQQQQGLNKRNFQQGGQAQRSMNASNQSGFSGGANNTFTPAKGASDSLNMPSSFNPAPMRQPSSVPLFAFDPVLGGPNILLPVVVDVPGQDQLSQVKDLSSHEIMQAWANQGFRAEKNELRQMFLQVKGEMPRVQSDMLQDGAQLTTDQRIRVQGMIAANSFSKMISRVDQLTILYYLYSNKNIPATQQLIRIKPMLVFLHKKMSEGLFFVTPEYVEALRNELNRYFIFVTRCTRLATERKGLQQQQQQQQQQMQFQMPRQAPGDINMMGSGELGKLPQPGPGMDTVVGTTVSGLRNSPLQQVPIPPGRSMPVSNANSMASSGLSMMSQDVMNFGNMNMGDNGNLQQQQPQPQPQQPQQQGIVNQPNNNMLVGNNLAAKQIRGNIPDMGMAPNPLSKNTYEVTDMSPAAGFTKLVDQKPTAMKRARADVSDTSVKAEPSKPSANGASPSQRIKSSPAVSSQQPEIVPIQKPRIENPAKLKQLSAEDPQKYILSVLGAILKVPPGELDAIRNNGDADISAPSRKLKKQGWTGAVAAAELRLALKDVELVKGLLESGPALPTPPQDRDNSKPEERPVEDDGNEWDYMTLLVD